MNSHSLSALKTFSAPRLYKDVLSVNQSLELYVDNVVDNERCTSILSFHNINSYISSDTCASNSREHYTISAKFLLYNQYYVLNLKIVCNRGGPGGGGGSLPT